MSRKAGRHYGTWGYADFQDGDPIEKRQATPMPKYKIVFHEADNEQGDAR